MTVELQLVSLSNPAPCIQTPAVRIPMYGCDCYAYGLLAAGYCDLVVEADLKPYDYMALVSSAGAWLVRVRLGFTTWW